MQSATGSPSVVQRRRLAVIAAAVFLLALQLAGVSPAGAHGSPTRPGSRTYLCRIDGTHASGDINPSNDACAAAVALGGKQPLWDWFGVLRSEGAGRTRGYIPDGQLCSGGEPKYAGYDLPRSDWPYTSLTGGADLTFRYNAWAAHPGEFRLYITKDGYDPTQPLGWDDLEDEPFSVYNQNSPNGDDAQNGTPDYQWTVNLPQKSGPHIIYSVWSRSDSNETFYGCSDVRFDGGAGEIVGIGAGANPVGAPEGGTAPVATTVMPDMNGTPETPSTTIAANQASSVPQSNQSNQSDGGGGQSMVDGGQTSEVAARSTGTVSSIAGISASTQGSETNGAAILVAAAGNGTQPRPSGLVDDTEIVGRQRTVVADAATADLVGLGSSAINQVGGDGATSWSTLLAGVAFGFALGGISCVAVYSTLKLRRLENRLNL